MQGWDHFKTMWMPLYECLESCTSVELSHVIIVSEGQPHNLPSCFNAWQLAGSLKDPACTAQAHAARPFLASSLETSVRSIVVKGGDVKLQGASSLEWGCSASIWSPIEITYELEGEVEHSLCSFRGWILFWFLEHDHWNLGRGNHAFQSFRETTHSASVPFRKAMLSCSQHTSTFGKELGVPPHHSHRQA